MNPFDVLGVPITAGDKEIQEAYRRLARQFHPDQHPGATSDEHVRLNHAMARINDAYQQIENGTRRATYVSPARPDAASARLRPPQPGECMLCGSHPASPFRFEHLNGWVLGTTIYTTEIDLCRNCALSYGRSKQNRTLWRGWWGLFAFFRNFLVVWRNGRGLFQARRLDPPQLDPDVIAPLSGPLDPGKSLFRRSGVWAVAIGWITLSVLGGQTSDPSRNAVTGEIEKEGELDASSAQVGDCHKDNLDRTTVKTFKSIRVVPCALPHSGEIFHRFQSQLDHYPTDDQFSKLIVEECLPIFYKYVGITYADSIFELSAMLPTAQSWATEGHRDIVCQLYDPAGTTQGSARDSSR